MIKVSERAMAIYKQLEAESKIEAEKLSPKDNLQRRIDSHLPTEFKSDIFWDKYKNENKDRNEWLVCQEGKGNVLLYRFSVDVNRNVDNPLLNNLFDYLYIDVSQNNNVHACLFSKVDMSRSINQKQAVYERNISKMLNKLNSLENSGNNSHALEIAHLKTSIEAMEKAANDIMGMVATPKFSELCNGVVIAYNKLYPDTTLISSLSELDTKDFLVDKSQLETIASSVGIPKSQLIMHLEAAVAYKQASSLYADGKINGYNKQLIESNINATFAEALDYMNYSLLSSSDGYALLDRSTGEVYENCQSATDVIDRFLSSQILDKYYVEPLMTEFKIAMPKLHCPEKPMQWIEWLLEKTNNNCSVEENRFMSSQKDKLNQLAVLVTANRNVDISKAALVSSVLDKGKDNYELAKQRNVPKSNTERE